MAGASAIDLAGESAAAENLREQTVLSLYLELYSLTESMRRHVADGDWEAVTGVEKTRQAVVERLKGREVNARDVDNVREILQRTAQLNSEMLDASKALHEMLATDLTALKQSRKADTAYRNNR